MPKALSDKVREQIKAMVRGGMTEREVADAMGVSKTTVHHTVAGRAPIGRPPAVTPSPARGVLAAPPVAPAPPAEPAPSAELSPPAEPLTDAEVITAMRRAVSETNRHAELARRIGDVRAAAMWGRLMAQTACELRKYLGAEETDPDDAFGARGEDVRTAAAAARAKLIAGLARVHETRSTWPRCVACGQPIRPTP